ncbi:MAG TPA: class I SAM-dependent methyltransferase [Xanthobacteraceae bacterium]|nr:class I SAM-dependent methyltransferase [Xanthobacteraceae bacterium]
MLTVPNPYVAGDTIAFARCGVCDSLTGVAGRFIEYTDDDGIDPVACRHYLHLGAGIDSMVRPIERVSGNGAAPSLLDVGCGFGFTLDYWRRMTGAEVAGVEPAKYGRMGRDMLGAPIHMALLSEATELRERRFGIVLSSEVIEHVPDPLAFVTELRSHLEPGGTLVLTTPRAEFVQPGTNPSTILAVLSPGLHKVLFSASGLEATLRAAGFSQVLVEAEAERLVAFAADVPIRLRPPGEIPTQRYHDYLVLRAKMPDRSADLTLGFRFRAIKELVNKGRMFGAAAHTDAFVALVHQVYGYNPLDAAALRARVLSARTRREYAEVAPFCLGAFLYYRAMAECLSGEDTLRGADLLGLAFEVLRHEVSIAPQDTREEASLVWLAAMERGCVLLSAGRREEAIAEFDTIPTEAARASDVLGWVAPGVKARVAFERAVAHLQLGRYAEAISMFADAMAKRGAAADRRAHARRLILEAADILCARESASIAATSFTKGAAPDASGLLIWKDAKPAGCPICGTAESKSLGIDGFCGVHALDGEMPGRRPLDIQPGPVCDNVSPHPFAQASCETDFGHLDYSRLYAQLLVDIEFMIRPLIAAHRLRPIHNFVDVGCGFGYTIDFAQRVFSARALGLDPSALAQNGARAFAIKILPDYLSEEPLPGEMQADLLFCREIIDHVEDPASFVRMMRGHLQPDGVLVLMTSASEGVMPRRPIPAVVASLRVSHQQVFSADAVADLLRRSDFAHVKVIVFEHRLLAFASDDATVLNATLEPDHRAYIAYLEALAADRGSASTDVRQGALYKVLAEYVSLGDWAQAETVLASAEEVLQQNCGLSFAAPEEVPARLVSITRLVDLPLVLPYWAPFALYFAGMLLLNGRGDAVGARRLFSAAHCAIAETNRLGLPAEPQIYWKALLYDGIAALVVGDTAAAEAVFDRIVAAAEELPATLRLTELEPATLARACVQRGVARFRLENMVGAAADFGRALDAAALLPAAEAKMVRELLYEAANKLAGLSENERAEFDTVEERDGVISDLKRTVGERDRAIIELNQQVTKCNHEIADSRVAMEALLHSRSWRITSPIRNTVTRFRRLSGMLSR